jgi:hypothetical protein
MTIRPERVLFAALGEDREPFRREIGYLFSSVRQFGGGLAQARATAYFIGSVDAAFAGQLDALDVSVRVVEPINPLRPHANKIRLLDADDEWDWLIMLDTDTVVVNDISGHILGHEIAAKPADWSPLRLPQWTLLYEYFGLGLPATRFKTSFHGMPIPPYFNSGVLIVPRQHALTLRDTWLSYTSRLEVAYASLPEVRARAFFTDQMALSLALISAGLPYRELPLEMNFPTHSPVRPAYKPENLTPCIVHYHHRMSPDGHLLPSAYAKVNAALDRVNRHVNPVSRDSGD